MKRRVVITGLGAVSPCGLGKKELMDSLMEGRNCISNINVEGLEDCYCKLHGMIDRKRLDEAFEKHLSPEERKLSLCSRLSILTAIMAAEDAGITFSGSDRYRTGVLFGTTQSDQYAVEDGTEELRHDRFTALMNTARHFDVHGPSLFNTNLCASGNHAVAYASDLIKQGRLDTAIVGGADVFSKITYVSFNRLKALTADAVRPFDKNRSGTVLSEGGAVLILEEYSHAKARNAHIYGEILGSGVSNDAYNIVAPDPSGQGIISAMEKAVKDSGIARNDVGFISLHGTGTPANDSAEMLAISEYFGSHAKEIRATAIKGSIGHQLGAASATSMIMCALIPEYGAVPPTINVTEPEETAFRLVTGSPERYMPEILMNNAYAFGGSNCSVIMRRWNENE